MANTVSTDAQTSSPTSELLAQAFAAHKAGDLPRAEHLYEAHLKDNSNDAAALALLGTLKGQSGHLYDALALLTRSVALDPKHLLALNSRGNVLKLLNRPDEALACFDKAVALKPDFFEAHENRGAVLYDLRRYDEALASYDRVLALTPSRAQSHCNRGRALEELDRAGDALASYNKAIALRHDYADAYHYRLNLLRDLGHDEDVLKDYETLNHLDPQRPYIAGEFLSQKLDLCLWNGFQEDCERIRKGVETGTRIATPFSFLKIASTPALQRRCAEIYVSDKCAPAPQPLWRGERYEHDRIRVGYFSSDFREHATAYLVAELLEKHDKTRFEVFGFSMAPATPDPMRERLKTAFAQFVDVAASGDVAAAQLAREFEIDIAVDLKGFTRDARPEIFAQRPAPLQVNYLGFPGTMDAAYIDYIIADHILIPPQHIGAYTEKIVFLPNSYQPNDTKRPIAPTTPTRTEAGLPEQGFVFCCFNNVFKITPDIFDIWMRLLHIVKGSVLWLFASHPSICANLRREAKMRGVDPDRLVFASKLPQAEHLARHGLADLFLDCFHYNAHTTASDALWAGLPVLTCPGETFASRVAASLLRATDLPELIAASPQQYESTAVHLARNPAALAALREKLAQNRLTQPLFDIELYTRHLETAYSEMYRRQRDGYPPDHIEIRP
jgi:predicted O-linked N-acetylglucosamine transferase (SPINDLY family)